MSDKDVNPHKIVVVRDTEKMTVKFTLIEKATEKTINTLLLNWSDVHDDVKPFVSLYGLSKIPMDRASGVDTIAKFDAFQELFDATLKIGLIKLEKQAAGKRLNDTQAEALSIYFSKKMRVKVTLRDVRENWKGKSEEDKAKILASPEVLKLIKKLNDDAKSSSNLNFDDLVDSE